MFSRLKAMTFDRRTTAENRLSVFPVLQLSAENTAALRGILRTSGFSTSAREDSAQLITLKRLFVRAETVAVDEAASALSPLDLAELIHAGLLQREDGRVRSLLQAQIYRGLIFFSDFLHNDHFDDFVLPIGPAGHYLAGLTIRKLVNSALDIGCGCGIQALLAAQHCTRVTATDVNPRALALTRLNADLNGVSNIEILEGSFFEPVKGRSFDLILANLPYVITPQNKLLYRDSLQPGDAGVRRLIREIPLFLAEGGYAQLLANWIHGKDESWWQPLKTTVEGQGVDAWLIHNGSKEPQDYADMWLDDRPQKVEQKISKTKKAWLKWYRDQEIERIALGVVILRRRASAYHWVRAADVTKSLDGPAGEQLMRIFEAQDYLTALPNREHLLEENLIPLNMKIEKGLTVGNIKVISTKGLFFQADIQPFTWEVIRHLDGKTSLRSAIQKAGQDWASASGQNNSLIGEIQTLLSLGMLVSSSHKVGGGRG
jgi:methylase of polypeptide subunit release factors